MDAWPENFFSPTDSLIASAVCINASAVYVNACGVYTGTTGVYRISRRRLYFFSHKNNFISFCIRFLAPLWNPSVDVLYAKRLSKPNECPLESV